MFSAAVIKLYRRIGQCLTSSISSVPPDFGVDTDFTQVGATEVEAPSVETSPLLFDEQQGSEVEEADTFNSQLHRTIVAAVKSRNEVSSYRSNRNRTRSGGGSIQR